MSYLVSFVIGILVVIAIIRFFNDSRNRRIVKSKWPAGLSRKNKVELWELETYSENDFYRIKDATLFLEDYLLFFLEDYRVPKGCDEDNPIIIVDNLDLPAGNEKILTRADFENRYKKYRPFDSYKEFDKYLSSLDFPT